MKIGILTYWWGSDNYGQLLQCYALQKYLRDLGHDVFFIRYNYNTEKKKNSFSFWKKAVMAMNPVIFYNHFERKFSRKKVLEINKSRNFDEFRNKYISFSENIFFRYNDLRNTPPRADAYIVGSDQVWNFTFTNNVKPVVHSYMLDFGEKNVKRFSYAASWGVSVISDELKREIAPLLKNFDYVSVREQQGIDLCKQCGYDGAEWVCDPTLLLSADSYRMLYSENKIRKPDKKYILLYMLANKYDFDLNAVYRFAKKKTLDVVFVTGNYMAGKREKFYATIPEWLYLVDNAEYVISNSFHCAIFSILFNKQFGVVRLVGLHEGMNSRLDSLFDLYGISARYLRTDDFSVLDRRYIPVKKEIQNHFLEKLLYSDT
ncbi:polysaccharide pyruvyl transferase family protein [Treponema sp. SP13]|uniref:polysaccharide pyruvyl transferase family protein n=1 Tax=Treponema sp. SP13 TaxID=2789742 RepID=UPI003D8BB24A